jgi:hypothetical protein
MESARLKKGGFDARFFLCVTNQVEVQLASSDNSEVFSLMWVSPHEALALFADGNPFPFPSSSRPPSLLHIYHAVSILAPTSL